MAAKFKYRLQKVLDMRVKREDAVKLEVAARKRERDTEQAVLDEFKERETNSQRQMNDQLAAGRTADVQMSNDYLGALADKIKAQEAKLKAAESRLQESEAEHKKAQRDLEIIKKHKEKSHERWRAEEKRLEDLKLEEMVSNMNALKQRKALEEIAQDEEYEERKAQAEALAQSMLGESAWAQGFLQTAYQEADRLNALNAKRPS
jgi:Flagellar FliJ protein.